VQHTSNKNNDKKQKGNPLNIEGALSHTAHSHEFYSSKNLSKFIVQTGRKQKDLGPLHVLCKIPNLAWNYHAWKFSIENSK
jgi:hypothetical protein